MSILRELSITYGGMTIGGNSSILLDGFTRHLSMDGIADSFVEFDAVVTSPTLDGFVGKCLDLERIFRKPRQALVVAQKGRVLVHAAHTEAAGGFNTEPEIRKIGEEGDTGRSRRYTIRVNYEKPADTVSTIGLRESTVNVAYDSSRIRTVRIEGTFTGVSGTPSARARYEAAIAAHAAAILTALGLTNYELTTEPSSEQDYDDKVLGFAREYKEIVFGQGQDAPNDDPDIVDQVLVVSRREISEERSPVGGAGSFGTSQGGGTGPPAEQEEGAVKSGSVQALAIYDLRYEASIDATRTTDLKAKYDSYRAWLVGQFSAAFSQGAFALTVERPSFDRVNNRLTVDMTAEGAVRGIDFVRRTVTTERSFETPDVYRGAWTGNPTDFYIYQGFENTTNTVTVSTRFLSTKDEQQAKEANEAAALGAGGSGGGSTNALTSKTSTTPVRIGIEGSGHILDMMDVVTTVTTKQATNVGGTGGASGGTGFGASQGFGSGSRGTNFPGGGAYVVGYGSGP